MPKETKKARILRTTKARKTHLSIVAVRHKAIMDKMAQNVIDGKKETLAQIQEGSGLSPDYKHLKDTDSWQLLMEQYIPDSLLATKHKELLDKKETVVKNNMTTGEIDVIPTGEIDTQAVSKGLDMAYKLKKRYDNTLKLTHQFGGLTDAELEDQLAGVISRVSEGLAASRGTEKAPDAPPG